ncbi:nucleoside-diphosphate sugar epimerase [Aeromicrobium sp. Root236]|uniref:NAD(P)H-binding protein n=1 Tax=Aeromicrobium sp. Root236 TaxID=1736498 RepID=UPI0006FE0121|nr:NAD(P)H-binding protein [Aeromicrobium sp. Root236]KRC64289.1 nucleoside-diphosphate sugar epimerase [Aeromicrobium sp. Root236]
MNLTTPKTILVTGATGQVGRHLVSELLSAGHRVRALSRNPEAANLPEAVDVIGGDFAGELPGELFKDLDAAFVFAADGAPSFVAAAAAAGVPRLVLLSSLAAALEHERDRGSVSQLHHSAIEEVVRESGVAWTILRPGTFANNLLTWAQPIRYTGGVTGPYPTSAQAPIHEADVAAAAAVVLTTAGHDGKIYAMTGPQALTRVDQLAAIGTAIGRELTFTENTPEEFRAEMAQYGVADGIVTMLLDYWSDTVDQPDVVRSPEALTGRPARTLADWARDHAADFSG